MTKCKWFSSFSSPWSCFSCLVCHLFPFCSVLFRDHHHHHHRRLNWVKSSNFCLHLDWANWEDQHVFFFLVLGSWFLVLLALFSSSFFLTSAGTATSALHWAQFFAFDYSDAAAAAAITAFFGNSCTHTHTHTLLRTHYFGNFQIDHPPNCQLFVCVWVSVCTGQNAFATWQNLFFAVHFCTYFQSWVLNCSSNPQLNSKSNGNCNNSKHHYFKQLIEMGVAFWARLNCCCCCCWLHFGWRRLFFHQVKHVCSTFKWPLLWECRCLDVSSD